MPKSRPPSLKIRVRLACGDEDAFGPGKAQILESLCETGSLNQTAAAMGMSYVKALALVKAMNHYFRSPLVKLSRGGKHGGGTQLTTAGRRVLADYQAICKASEAAAVPVWRRLRRSLKSSA